MTGITCTNCGTYITVRGLDQCPICRGPVIPVGATKLHRPSQPKISMNVKHGAFTGKEWLLVSGFVIIAICLAIIVWGAMNPSPAKIRETAVLNALQSCRQAIISAAAYGDADRPPYVKNDSSITSDFFFSWPPGSFEFSNAFGAKVKMSASCTGKIAPLQIFDLTLNGRKII